MKNFKRALNMENKGLIDTPYNNNLKKKNKQTCQEQDMTE